MRGRVVVVTGGGGGIGTETALEVARRGATVVAMDPGWTVDGEPAGEQSAAETARRVEELGGTALASTASVTDGDAVRELFAEVVQRFGSLDAVVNTAGIVRSRVIGDASERDWTRVVDVHVNGYLNVLSAALPLMAEAGYGRVVGFTSGVGLARTSAQGPAYGTAKRAVASLTWELGPLAPPGVTVNALSPIAATRMVREALVASGVSPRGLDLTAMPQPSDMAPAAALLASEAFGWCTGRVVFSAGSELSLIAPPRLIEAVGTGGAADFGTTLSTVVPVVFGPAEAEQRTSGGSNPRFGPITDIPAREPVTPTKNCLVVSDDAEIAAAVEDALRPWGLAVVTPKTVAGGFEDASRAVAGQVDAVVVALRETPAGGDADWRQVLDSHAGTTRRVLDHAAWLSAAVRHATGDNRPVRVVHVVPADSPGGRSVAQAVTQMARSAQDTPSTTDIDVFAVTVEGPPADRKPLGALVARLAAAEDTRALAGAELVVRGEWAGLRAHPGPAATVVYGGPAIPDWAPGVLREAIR
ncbi:MAG TPA: SDR family NAD(P)-dependent oxidoreductase [Amycolatopsis sp.]|nr:SDR family NAD(P)-dependent oxidoreductase [Amycolatopsis sp.]